MSNVLGIDLGTGNTAAAIYTPSGDAQVLANGEGDLQTRSALYHKNGRVVIGKQALHLGVAHPEALVVNPKRWLGTDEVLYRAPDGREYRARDEVELQLKHCGETAMRKTGQPVTEVAVCRPANFPDAAIRDLVTAAEAAGLRVVLTPQEPTAGALGNGVQNRGDGIYVIVDLGHGTFDVSVVKVSGNSVEVLYSRGVEKLGGIELSAALQAIVLEEFEAKHGYQPTASADPLCFQQLLNQIEGSKIQLSESDEATVLMVAGRDTLPVTVKRRAFEDRIRPVIDQALACVTETLDGAKVRPEDVREWVPVGGASQTPAFHAAIKKTFGREVTVVSDPQYAVVRGTLLAGRVEKERNGESVEPKPGRKLPPLTVKPREVCANNLGVLVDEGGELVCSVLVGRGKPIPADVTETFCLKDPLQTSAHVVLVNGEDGATETDCHKVGELHLENLQAVDGKPHPIELRIKLTKNALVEVFALDAISNVTAELEIT